MNMHSIQEWPGQVSFRLANHGWLEPGMGSMSLDGAHPNVASRSKIRVHNTPTLRSPPAGVLPHDALTLPQLRWRGLEDARRPITAEG